MDFIMPEMNGKTVYDEIGKIQPDIKVLFTSGYTFDVIHRRGIFEKDVIFTAKPIATRELLKKCVKRWSAGL